MVQIRFDNSYARLPETFYSRIGTSPVAAPELVALNETLAAELGLDINALQSRSGLAVLSGSAAPDGADPIAQVYAGHQFGGFSPRLGDGRAMLLGEVIDLHGNRQDIQLKGSGRTPYSRRGDGRAWLGPVLREYLISEAMHALGIPTTRALAAVTSGQNVQREIGRPGAILTRIASSHIRVGTFEYFAARQDHGALRSLTDYTIARHFPGANGPLDLLRSVCQAQAKLVARWLGVGFIHGVMNTDNTHVAGITIDYGPCAFMDAYDPMRVYSAIDQHGRYAYGQQSEIIIWNLAQFASALIGVIDSDHKTAIAKATEIVHDFPNLMRNAWLAEFRAKLGLLQARDGDKALIDDFLNLMAADQADFTNTFRALAGDDARGQFVNPAGFDLWQPRWQARLADEGGRRAQQQDLIRQTSPAIIARNHRVEEMIVAAVEGNYAPFKRLNAALLHPFETPLEHQDLRRAPTKDEQVHQTFCGT